MAIFNGKPNFKHTIGTMKQGEKGFVSPLALVFSIDGTAYLNTSFSVSNKPEPNTSKRIMPVTRTGPGEADYEVDINFKYEQGKNYKYEWVRKRFPFKNQAEANNSIEVLAYSGKQKNLRESKKIAQRIKLSILQRKFPNTWAIRDSLDQAVLAEEYELAANLKEQIEKLEKEELQKNIFGLAGKTH